MTLGCLTAKRMYSYTSCHRRQLHTHRLISLGLHVDAKLLVPGNDIQQWSLLLLGLDMRDTCVGLFLIESERKFHVIFVPGNKSFKAFSLPGRKFYRWNFCSRERKFLRAKVPVYQSEGSVVRVSERSYCVYIWNVVQCFLFTARC